MYWLIGTIALLIISLLITEVVIAKRRKISIYNFSDSFTNLYCGVLERVFDLVFSVLILFLLLFIGPEPARVCFCMFCLAVSKSTGA